MISGKLKDLFAYLWTSYTYRNTNLRPLTLGTIINVIIFKDSAGICMRNEIQGEEFRFCS